MGLDNLISVKRTEYTEKIHGLRRFEDEYSKKYMSDFEVCYWRKSYNIRSKIIGIVGAKWRDNYETTLDVNDIEKIIQCLRSFNKHNWTDSGYCIWDWDESKRHIKHNIKDLKYLRRLMKKHELDVVFVDSY